jgi:SAM-dependent methyltransferase
MNMNIEQIVAEMRQKIASRPVRDEDDFSESEYLELYPDVGNAVAAGTFRSGYEHWIRSGRAEGRRGRKRLAGNATRPSGAVAEGNSMPSLKRSSRALQDVRSRTIPPHLFDGIGEPTPLLNTARGRLAHALMRWLGKVLWWYSYRLKQALESVVSTLNGLQAEHVRALEALQEDLRDIAARQEDLRKNAARQEDLREIAVRQEDLREMAARQEDLQKSAARQEDLRKMGAQLEALQQGLRELAAEQDDLRKTVPMRIESLDGRLSEVAKSMRESGTIHIPNLANRIAALGLYAQQTRADLSLQDRRLSLLLQEARKQMREPPDAPAPFAPELCDGSAGLYVDFEAAFRGTREEIRQKQSVYIPMLRDAGAGRHDRPVVDLGCGRGEWLELLRAEQMQASGVDSNESMIETCRGLGLNAVLGDAFSHLRGLPESSVGAVTAFHLVEHLPFDVVLALIDESIRVLRPDGILILETPNPGNILVGAQYFYLDPTHIRPLPSPMLRFFVEARGMCRVEIHELHPYPESLRVPEDGNELAKRFNDYFYGPRDYAVVARRP